ncbi:hypothetical protein Cgig2_009341 [Carnegiea gigantea]|uniref:Uncharacterized protein n=1 Tax=Carnegiea gigantea TaxID=171969 RepID=A0A9Q1GPJ1_9CARY|nr:hypothetical protein Cgig2_009341 [Carnegiea gigantea]
MPMACNLCASSLHLVLPCVDDADAADSELGACNGGSKDELGINGGGGNEEGHDPVAMLVVQMEGGGVRGVIAKEVVFYVCFGGYIEEVSNRRVLYVGGRTECVWMWENVGEVAAIKLVEEVLGECLGECTLWFSMKFDRRIVVPFGRDGDLLKLMKGNDEFIFMYVGGKDGPSRVAVEVRNEEIPLCATTARREGVGCLNRKGGDAGGSGDRHDGGGSTTSGR